MRRKFILFTLLIAVCSLAVWAGANPQKGKEKEKAKADTGKAKEARDKESSELKARDRRAPEGDVIRDKKAPEGAVIKGNKITLKAGYHFEKPSGNTVAVARANNGGITGSFSCACQEGTAGGGICQLSITKEVALCAGSCKDCRLEIVIDPKAVPINKAQIQKTPLKKAKN